MGILTFSVGLIALAIWTYHRWNQKLTRQLFANSSTAQTSKGQITYTESGTGEPIIVLHGSPSGHDFIHVVDYLAEAGFRVIVPSRPGYPGTHLSVGQSPEQQADAVIALMNALEIEKAGALGFSGGGPIALQCAIRYPNRFVALGLNCAITGKYDHSGDLENLLFGKLFFINGIADVTYALMSILTHRFPEWMLREIIKLVTTYEDTSQLNAVLSQIFADEKQINLATVLVDNAVPYGLRKAGFENDMAYYRDLPSYPFEQIQMPTLIIHSRVDGDVNYQSHALPAYEGIPNAELLTIDGAGHLIWLGDEGISAQAHQIGFLKQAMYKVEMPIV